MKLIDLTLPRLLGIAVTRALAGAGIGLLLADRIPHTQRRLLGATLLGIGIASTVPLALPVIRNLRMRARARAKGRTSYEGLPAD